jgi:hypothetical protein
MLRVIEDNAYRNWCIHCKNPVSPITAAEIRGVVAGWRSVEAKLHCPDCHGVVKYDEPKFRCRCGKTVLEKTK